MAELEARTRGNRAGLIGATAGLAGGGLCLIVLAAEHLLVPAIPFPPAATAQWIVGELPGGIDTYFIDRLHHLALPLAYAATGLGFLLASVSLVLASRRWHRGRPARLPIELAALLPLWGLWIVASSPDRSGPPKLPFALVTLPAAVVGGLVAARFADGSGGTIGGSRDGSRRGPNVPDPMRRRLVGSLSVGAAALLLGVVDLRSTFGNGGARQLHLSRLRAAPAVPAAGPTFTGIPGLTPRITPVSDFYVVDEALVDPVLDPSTWTLAVGGSVRRALSFSFDELLALPAVERYQTLECISNPVGGGLISTARWEGIPLLEILDRAGVEPGAVEVVFHSADGYSDSLPVAQAMDDRTLVVVGMNGYELPTEHGFPARILSLGTYGMKNPKWLTSIEVVDRPYTGFWETRGWSKAAVAKTGCRIDVPSQGSAVDGDVTVAGVAYAADRGISAVQVSTDGGRTWGDATLETPPSPYTWVRWRYLWTPRGPGVSTLRARAVDGRGVRQPSAWAPPHPSGASGYPQIAVRVDRA